MTQNEVMIWFLLSQFFKATGSNKNLKLIMKHNSINIKMEKCTVYSRPIAARSICYMQFWTDIFWDVGC